MISPSPVCHKTCSKQNKYRSNSSVLLAVSIFFPYMIRIDAQLEEMWNHIANKLSGIPVRDYLFAGVIKLET